MTAEIVNLRLHRKRRKQVRKDETAAENRARFGRSKADRSLAKARREQDETRLDGHRRNPEDS